jgi:hypothetical protein
VNPLSALPLMCAFLHPSGVREEAPQSTQPRVGPPCLSSRQRHTRMRSALLAALTLVSFVWVIAITVGIFANTPAQSDGSFKAHLVRFCKAVWVWSP